MTFDIQDLFVNIPTQEILQITKLLLLKNNNPNVTQQIIELLRLILSQNYFTFQNKIFQPQKGISMGSPISSITAEIFLQYLEEQYIKQLLDSRNIIFYTRYVDDILIIYDSNKIQPKLIETHINQRHNNIKLNPTQEENGNINFLDLNINRKPPHLETDIYRKPTTTTDTTISFESNHPLEHKTAAFRYHITRMHLLPLTAEKKQKEWKTIQHIATKNNFPQNLLQKLKQQITHKVQTQKTNDSHKTWTTFTHYSQQIRKITNLFKNTNIRIAFRSTNTIKRITKRKTNNSSPDYDKSGIYKIKCNTCHRSYIGQTKRSLKLRYQEHFRYIRNNNPQSAYAQHILNNRHEYGPMHNTMELLKQINKTKFLIPYEQLYI
jgi:hypothetical protein